MADFQTTCLIIDAMPGGIGQTWFSICLFTNVATVVSYGVVWAAIKIKTSKFKDFQDSYRRIAFQQHRNQLKDYLKA